MFSDFYRMDFGRGSELLARNTNTNLTVTTQSAPRTSLCEGWYVPHQALMLAACGIWVSPAER